MNAKYFILCLITILFLAACKFFTTIYPVGSESNVDLNQEVLFTPTSPAYLSKTPSSIPLTQTEYDDLCILFPNRESIWFKRGTEPPIEISVQDIRTSNAQCPTEELLPLVEVNISEIGTPETNELRNLIPQLCKNHPTLPEIWFNTEQPLSYGKYYQSDLWRFRPDNNTVEQILEDKQGGQFFSFSPDGNYLILADNKHIKVMHLDGSELRLLFDFPEVSICSEVNVWTTPWWHPESSGVFLFVPVGCLNDPETWPFGFWWIPLEGEAVSIDPYIPDIVSQSLFDPTSDRRIISPGKYVYFENGTISLVQDGAPPIELVTLDKPEEGYSAFTCPNEE